MNRFTIVASSLASSALALFLGQACSSDDADQDIASQAGAGGMSAPAGAGGSAAAPAPGNSGATPAPGTGAAGAPASEGNPVVAPPAAAAGSANAGAMAGAGAGGAAGAAGAGGAPPATGPADMLCPPQDPSPSDNVACTVTCTDPCGVKNLGERLCTCTAGVFDCASCGYEVEHPLLVPPTEPLADCALSDDLQEDDETGCTDNERCQSIGRTPGAADGADRFCGCLGGSWDCDTKPDSFGG